MASIEFCINSVNVDVKNGLLVLESTAISKICNVFCFGSVEIEGSKRLICSFLKT